MSIKEIFCQDKAILILQQAFASGKMPHAYIFAGPEGVGKFKTAHEWAKALLCKERIVENDCVDSCGSCESCRLFEAGTHPDFHHVYKELRQFTREGKSKAPPVDLPIDVIREFLIEKVSARPALSEKKVFVVSEAEKLNIHSQNALLKVTEEPPGFVSVILLCSRLEKLLPTIKSRCQTIRFAPVEEDKITEQLKQMGIEATVAKYFARLSQGSLGLACQWGRLQLAEADLYNTKTELLSSLAAYRYAEAVDLAQHFLQESKRIAAVWAKLDEATSAIDINRRAAKTLVRIIISALHDAMKLNVTGKGVIINFDQPSQVKQIAKRFDAETAAEKISQAYKTMRWIDSSVNEKLIFEQLLLNLAVCDRIQV